MTTSSLKYDHNIIIINSAESLKLFWYDQVARRWAEIKNLQILYYLWKKLSKFCNAQKKVSHAFSFQLCSTANSKFSFYVSLCEINCIKIQTVSLVVLNLSILAEIFCIFPYFDVIIRQRLKKVEAG